MSFWTSLLNFFRSNKAILQIAIQTLAGEFFTRKPRYKTIIDSAITKVINASNSTMSMGDVSGLLLKYLDLSSLPAPEQPAAQAIINTLMDSVNAALSDYFKKASVVSQTDQYNMLMQVLLWIQQMARV